MATKTSHSADKALREHLLFLLQGGGAHAKFENVIAGWPAALYGKKVEGLPYSAWMLLEHLVPLTGESRDLCFLTGSG